MSIEQEIIETVGFEPRRNYKDRQDYLAALARSVDQADNDDFDKLPKEAVDWFNAAVRAINKKEELPDFESEEVDDTVNDTEPEEETAPVEEAPKTRKRKATPAAEVAHEEETVVAATPARRRKGQAPVKREHPPVKPLGPDEMVRMDRFGIVEGSKNAAAAAMLAKGCRMADVTETLGGTYYNLVARLVKQGHKLEKGANGMLKITHEDDIGKKAKK